MVLLVPLFFLACFLLNLLAARKTSGGVTRGGAVAATYMAGLAALPAAVLAAIAHSWELDGIEQILGCVLVLLVFAHGLSAVKQPFEHAVPMDDPELEATIARVAERAGLHRVPRLLRLRTLGAMPVYAWVAALHEPVVILADGLVHRLEPDEHEAIIAHELAHVRTGSLWWLQLPLPLAATTSMGLLVWVDMWVAIGSAWALWALLARLITRPTERLCDRRAGELTSPAAMISGLRKMHAVHPARDPGWRWTVAWALSTHPPTQLRVHALGEDQGPVAARLRRASVVGFTLWGLLYIAVLSTWFLLPGLSSFAIGAGLVALGLGLQISPRLASRAAIRRRKRLVPKGLPGRPFARVAWGLFGFVFATIMMDWMGWWTSIALVGSIALGAVAALRNRGLQELRNRVHKHLQAHNFDAIREIGAFHRRRLRRDPGLRHDVALASLALGHRDEALASLEQIVETAPAWLVAALTLGKARLQDEPALALSMGRKLSAGLPDDAPGPIIECMAQRGLGHHAEAMEAWARARAVTPDDPGVLVLAVELALDTGDLDEAERWAAQARERAPGGLELQLAETRLAIARGEPARARTQLERARAILADHPLSLLEWRVEALEAELGDRDPEEESA